MSYSNLQECVYDLEQNRHLVRINGFEVDPNLELAAIQRRAYRAGSPALLFSRVKGSIFPMLANLYGTQERLRYIFRSSLRGVEALLRTKADPHDILKHPLRYRSLPKAIFSMLPRKVRTGPVLENRTTLAQLPHLVSWPKDGGAYITLPLVYTEPPANPGLFTSNLGMYRVQISGNDYIPDHEVGLHYQIHRGIGPHHMQALERGDSLPVNIFVGGPPALTLAAIMPLPEGMPEICFAGALGGRRISMITGNNILPIAAEADFCISGHLRSSQGKAATKPEGPFGDHLGYYSLTHDFPVMQVDAVYHRTNAIWPFTSVGRPPQEDTEFGGFIHALTEALIPTVFTGVHEVHAVDAAGVHPLLLAIGSERYVPFADNRIPQELLTCGLGLLGNTQTSLTKYLFIAAREDASTLSCHHILEFLTHILLRTQFNRDLHFITRTTIDTLDYSGISLNQGSKLLWAAAGKPIRKLLTALPSQLTLPEGFSNARLFAPGIALCQGPKHVAPRNTSSQDMEILATHLAHTLVAASTNGKPAEKSLPEELALIVVVDDADFVCSSLDNFLWTTFTRSDPATDIYGPHSASPTKHWGCSAPLIIDARGKSFHAPPLEDDPDVERKIDALAVKNGPLYGLV